VTEPRLDLVVDPEAEPADLDQALAKFLLSVLNEKSSAVPADRSKGEDRAQYRPS